jgi:hypothetical protein
MKARFTLPVNQDICHAQSGTCLLRLSRRNIMSGSNDLAQIRSITISDTHDLFDIPSEATTYSKELESGIVLTITIEKGKIVRHVAKDREGKSLKTFHLQMHSIAPEDEGTVCYICYSGDGDYGSNQRCFRIGCGWLPPRKPQ